MAQDELTIDEIDAMGADEIAKVEVDTDTGVASITPAQQTQIPPEKPEKPPEAPAAESKPGEAATTEKPADVKSGDTKVEAPPPPEKPDDKPGEKAEDDKPKADPLKDTQKAYHKSREELAVANREIARMEQEIEKSKIPVFEEESEEALESLKLESPDDYEAYNTKKEAHDKQVADYDEKKAVNVAKLQKLELAPWLKNNHDLEFSADSDPEALKKTQDYLDGEDFEKFNEYVAKNVVPDALGIYSTAKIQNAWNNFDKSGYETRIREAAKKEQLTELQELNNGAIFNQAGGDQVIVETDPAKFTQEQIDGMDEKQTEAALKKLEAEEFG